MSPIMQPHMWRGVQVPDLAIPLSDNLTPMIGSGLGVHSGTPDYSNTPNATPGRMRGLLMATSTEIMDIDGANYRGDQGSLMVWINPRWAASETVLRNLFFLMPMDDLLAGYLGIYKPAAGNSINAYMYVTGATKDVPLVIDDTKVPAETPFMLGVSWRTNYVMLCVNATWFKTETTITVGSASPPGPTVRFGHTAANRQPNCIFSDLWIWKDVHEDTLWWKNLFNLTKATHGRDV